MRKVNKVIPGEPHWFTEKAILFVLDDNGRTPATFQEWVRFIWNADIFIGEVPMLKAFTLLNILVSLLV